MKYNYKNTELNYEIIGKGKPLLAIHGFSCDLQVMKGCIEPVLAGVEGYQRIYVDLPGMGSSYAPMDIAESDKILEVLIAFVDDVIKDKVSLIGYSYGGYLSLGLLAKRQLKIAKLFLICPVVVPTHKDRILASKDITVYDESFLAGLEVADRTSFCEYAIVANETTYNRYVNEILCGMKRANNDFLNHLENHYAYTFDLIQELNQLHTPTEVLFLAGKQDVCVGYEDLYHMAQQIPRSSFYLMDKAGHNLQIDQLEWFETLLLSWL